LEWLVDADGCRPEALRDLPALRRLCDRIITELELHVVGEPLWHRFPGPGGVTGLFLLTESHLTVHTFPESGLATFNLYCCRPRQAWPWADRLAAALGAAEVHVRTLARGPERSRP
jgi:S-adenosylmethionine decarboxylase